MLENVPLFQPEKVPFTDEKENDTHSVMIRGKSPLLPK